MPALRFTLGAADDATPFGGRSFFTRDDAATERFNHSVVAPDDDADRSPRAVLAYIERVLNIVDPERTPTRVLEPPAPGPAPAPILRVQRRPIPVATGTPRDVLAYIDAETARIDANIAADARARAEARAEVSRGNGYAVGGNDARAIPGIITEADRAQRLIDDIRRDWAAGLNVNGHARAQFTRRVNEAVRTLVGRHGLSLDEITARVNGDDA